MRQREISSAWDFGGKDIWDYIVPERSKNFPEITDPKIRALLCKAIFYGGNTLRLWNGATELKTALLSACALGAGQKVLLVAKYAEESGIAQALRSLVGPEGTLTVEEIGPRAMAGLQNIDTVSGVRLQWDFSYFDSLADKSLDRVIIFGAASHVNNWDDCARHINRVLKDGGRVIIAEAPMGGKELLTAVNLESHLKTILAAVLSGMRMKEDDLPVTGPEELSAIFKPFLSWDHAFSWRGLYLYYGQKGGDNKEPHLELPISTESVQAFLTEKPSSSPWDFLAAAEVTALGSEVQDVENQRKWGRVISYGGSADWAYEHAAGVMYHMYCNLKTEPGYKVLVIGEWLDRLFLPELQRRIGDSGEIVAFDIHNFRSMGIDDIGPKRTNYDFNDFADRYLTFPDNYFDLIWLPQGVHHVVSWKEFAPKLLRVLKPGHQVMMLEWRHPAEPFFTATGMSGLLECIADKIYWASGHAPDDLPDVPTADVDEAVRNYLTDTYSIEWFGFLLYSGYKK